MVYREIFQEDQVIHVVVLQPEARMGHVRCKSGGDGNDGVVHDCFGKVVSVHQDFWIDNTSKFEQDDDTIGTLGPGEAVLPLLRTCRQMYVHEPCSF